MPSVSAHSNLPKIASNLRGNVLQEICRAADFSAPHNDFNGPRIADVLQWIMGQQDQIGQFLGSNRS